MDIDSPGRNEGDRQRLDAILNSGNDRELLKSLRNETQYLVLRVRVLQQERKDEWEFAHQEGRDEDVSA